jgi:ornithine cyclodeaminase/alanine dehydrogenase-like protein (mu-crystallin family)
MSLFKCVGVGGMDVAVTELVVRSAEEKGVGLKAPF